jgi:hypothetical protein
MSTSFRAFIALSVLSVVTAIFANTASAADYAIDQSHRVYHRAHYRASFGFIAGVRGANPLTVPFFGDRWSPGPVYYYETSPWLCCYSANEPSVSVRY